MNRATSDDSTNEPDEGTRPGLCAGTGRVSREHRGVRVAYVMSRFPKLSETFVLYEIIALRQLGVHVDIYPLLRERQPVTHEEATALTAEARFLPFVSPAILASQAVLLSRRPRCYLGALRDVIQGTWGSWNFLAGGLAIFMKVAHAARLMEASGVTHVHCHFANHPALAGFVIRRLTGIPYSFTAHGSDLHKDRRMLCRKVTEAAFVATISEFNRGIILEECDGRHADKIVVVHCGVDTEVFLPPGPSSRDEEPPFTVICVGTLHEVKGQSYLIDACRLLVESGIDLRCRLVGDGPDRRVLEQQAKAAGLADRVAFAGSLPRSQVARMLRDADVLAAPSVPTRSGRREGIPVVLMEAMSTGLPVVASRLSGIPELVEEGVTGVLVQPGDAAGLADALRRLHGDPELRHRLGTAGRRKVERDFDLYANAATLASRFAVIERAA